MRAALLLCSAIVGAGCESPTVDLYDPKAVEFRSPTKRCPAGKGPLLRVDLRELLTNGSKYNGRAVVFSGYYTDSFEHSAMYVDHVLNPFDRVFEDGVWIDHLMPISFNGKELIVAGTFTSGSGGHGGQWSGSVCATYASIRSRTAA